MGSKQFLFVASVASVIFLFTSTSEGRNHITTWSEKSINAQGSGLELDTRSENYQHQLRATHPGHVTYQNLKIAAFNVQTFGRRKMSYADVTEILVKIILRYHVVLIQEIRDATQTAMPSLLTKINRGSAYPYSMSISDRLGRTRSKEQYAFVFRSDLVSVQRAYVYDDGDEDSGLDTFEREPYIVHLHSPYTVLHDFALVSIHTSPSKAAREIDALADVYNDVRARWSMDDVIIMGDFNAACSYMKDADWRVNRLATDQRFSWIISDCVDTTVAGSACAYDRFVSAGSALASAVVPGSAGRFKFDAAYNLTETMAKRVSDHYPIEMEIYCKDLVRAMKTVRQKAEHKFVALTPQTFDPNLIYQLRHQSNPLLSQGFTLDTRYSQSAISTVLNTKAVNTSGDAVLALKQIDQTWPALVTRAQVDMAAFKAAKGLGTSSAVVKLVCRKLPAPAECWVALEL